MNTVSRALTGKPDVNAETRARVQALARELGYMPNLLARSLLRGRSWLVGLVVTDCTNPFYAGLIRAAETTLSRRGYGMLLATSNEDSAKESRALTILQEHRVDGILLTAVDVRADHVQRLLSGRTPVVLLGRRDPAYAGPFVGTDNVAGAERIVRYLIARGTRRIAHIARADGATSAGERLAGYRNGLTEAGIGYDGRMVFSARSHARGRRNSGRLGAGPFARSDCRVRVQRLAGDRPDASAARSWKAHPRRLFDRRLRRHPDQPA